MLMKSRVTFILSTSLYLLRAEDVLQVTSAPVKLVSKLKCLPTIFVTVCSVSCHFQFLTDTDFHFDSELVSRARSVRKCALLITYR
jgi:hypothetical protein